MGRFNYGTAFGGTPLEAMSKDLIRFGFSPTGKESAAAGCEEGSWPGEKDRPENVVPLQSIRGPYRRNTNRESYILCDLGSS